MFRDRVGHGGEQLVHLLAALQIVLRRVADTVVRVDGLGGLDTDEHVVREMIGGKQVVAVVRRDDAQAQILGEAERSVDHLLLAFDPVVL